MISFWRIFWLEFTGFVRSKTLALLVAASALWMLGLPFVMKGDGTADGARELYIHYSLGGVFTLLVIALLASATGSLAREREAKRLQLTLVRPVRYALIVLGKILAHVAAGALVLAVACTVLALKTDLAHPCSHVLSPILPSPREEAKAMYDVFMADPETPEAVKLAKKEVVLRLLQNKALDHYQTVLTNGLTSWKFALPAEVRGAPSVRLRFTNQFDSRDTIRGTFTLEGWTAAVSNITQAVLSVPLVSADASAPQREVTPGPRSGQLSFANEGRNALMLRPRKDIAVLLPADAFVWNLARAYVCLVAILALLVAFGLFLSASLGRPVALFVAIVTVVVSEMSPSVIEQYPDELETKLSDRIGLMFTRAAAEVTRPVAALNPLEKLSLDECVEPALVRHAVLVDLLVLPFLLALISGYVLPRKQDD